MKDSFVVKKTLGKARVGVLNTAHGKVETPNFAFVATHGLVKLLDKKDHAPAGVDLTISNTFHLFVTDAFKKIKKAGGLHKNFGLKNPIMTDSGGFQVFSLGWGAKHGVGKISSQLSDISRQKRHPMSPEPMTSDVNRVKIIDDGVSFIFNDKKYFLDPEKSIAIQKDLGADIIFAFDECTSPLHSYDYNKRSLLKTHRWARESIDAHRTLNVHLDIKCPSKKQLLFGIVQGGIYEDLRKQSSKTIGALPFDGFGIGGSFGEKQMNEVLKWALSGLPENKPRHLLGIGKIKDIFIGVKNGIDTFDCVVPSREARHGKIYSMTGAFDARRTIFAKDKKAVDKSCHCPACKKVPRRADIHKIFKENLPEAQKLATIHNIFFYKTLFERIRKALSKNDKKALKKLEILYKPLTT